MGVLVAGFGVADCSSSPAVNLKQDEINIVSDSSAVSNDQAALRLYQDLPNALAILCATDDDSSHPNADSQACPGSAKESGLQAKLKSDQLKLKVARDQLKKDESS
jgi:hypothetical protein